MNRKQGFNLHGADMYKQFQDLIFADSGVECSVVVGSHCISIRTKDYADYVIAKSVIKGRTGLDIVRAEV
jgi:hypothetical protein